MLEKKESPYEKCPVYETNRFLIRLVHRDDAEDLLTCYSDPAAARLFNSDNCRSNFNYQSLEEIKHIIDFWLYEYGKHGYIRFSIVDKEILKVVGTIEMFARQNNNSTDQKTGVLRIDLASAYEQEDLIEQILELASSHFFEDFKVEHIITKAIPEAAQRITALKNNEFTELEVQEIVPYSDYYLKLKPAEIN